MPEGTSQLSSKGHPSTQLWLGGAYREDDVPGFPPRFDIGAEALDEATEDLPKRVKLILAAA
jgi:hypothetical protein